MFRIARSAFLLAALFSLCVFFSDAPKAHAVTEASTGDNLAVDISPANPGPRTATTLKLSSLTTDLTGATITWSVNGKQVDKGPGKQNIDFTTGAAGSKTTVFIVVDGTRGEHSEKTLTFMPQELAVLWEAQTYTPPFYKGKALPSPGSTVRLSALPHFVSSTGKAIASEELIYTWKQLGSGFLPNTLSGKNKQSFEVTTGIAENTKVTVTVSTSDNTLRADKTVEIPVSAPGLLLYEEKPLEGTDWKALSGIFTLTEPEVTVRAEPFFFGLPLEALSPQWILNNQAAVADPTSAWLTTLRGNQNGGGSATLQIGLRNNTQSFQAAQNQLEVHF